MDMTPADFAAMNGNDGMFGGNGVWFLALLFLFGGGFGGYGARNQAATTDELSAGFNFSGINNKLNDITAAISTEGRTTDNAICQLGYRTLEQTSALSAQMASCCCDLKTAIHAEGEATRSMIQQNKIESLQAQINQLNLQTAMCGVVRYPTAATYAVPGGCFGYNTCGCNGAF